jgi:heat shock protein HslJ
VGDEPVPAGAPITLSFAAGTVSGSAGCNTYRGPYTLDGSSLLVGLLTTTRKACPDPVMAVETMYLTTLTGVARWAVPQDAPIGTQLTLLGSGPKLVFGPAAAKTTG